MDNVQDPPPSKPRGVDSTIDEPVAMSDSEHSSRVTRKLRDATIEETRGNASELAPRETQGLPLLSEGSTSAEGASDIMLEDNNSRGRGLRRKRSHDEVEGEITEEINGQKAGKHSRKRSRDGDADPRIDSDNEGRPTTTRTHQTTDAEMGGSLTNGAIHDSDRLDPATGIDDIPDEKLGASPKNPAEVAQNDTINEVGQAQNAASQPKAGDEESKTAGLVGEPRTKRAQDSPQLRTSSTVEEPSSLKV
ncbi:hypothetical protein LTS18_008387 [Coniosporium uncinatum]|uniref:Uncharacterized protein n=1 Tax=Coniosporium uncinatum TaxID=93489 RepID=A0ACC3D210_9PEZI|nr:hypothetical protein LTS18_008387 [Coniosporium uncinatum]